MLTREDGTPITPDNLTDEDVALSDWDILDSLDSEHEISLYLQAALEDIDEGECDAGFFFEALADVAKARTINQLATETGIDRKTLCSMFVEHSDTEAKAPEISHDVILKVASTFAAPVPV